MTILVIEDNPHIAALFAEALDMAGYEFEIVTSGASALARLMVGCELALMDLSLPDLNGAEVAVEARAAGCTVPIIAISGAMPLIDEARLAKAGFAAALAKPVRLSTLIDLVRQHARPLTPAASPG